MKNFINIVPYILLTCFFYAAKISAVTRVCMGNGNWALASTWSPAGVPACGDSIVINAGDTVNITNQQNYSACAQPLKIVVKGTIWFFNGSKLRLPCGSYVIVHPGGSLWPDVGLSNSNLIEICGVVEWNSNDPLYGPACLPSSHPVCQSILPVELLSFSVENCLTNKICLKWQTASEKNNHHYEIERSENALDFSSVYLVPSKAPGGNSNYKISYEAIDERPLNNINYYRLKQVDNDLTNTYSKIITIQLNPENGLQFLIFPNSNSGEFTGEIHGMRNQGNITVILRDISGAIMYKALHFADAFYTQIRVAPHLKLQNGIYFCSFIIGETEHVVKIIVTN